MFALQPYNLSGSILDVYTCQEWGWNIFNKFEEHCKVPDGGYTDLDSGAQTRSLTHLPTRPARVVYSQGFGGLSLCDCVPVCLCACVHVALCGCACVSLWHSLASAGTQA